MCRNRCVLLTVAVALAIQLTPATAPAQPGNPLYRLVDTAAQRLAATTPAQARGLDPLYRQALTSATRSYCRLI
jgi:hypothetical protein